jgi:glutamine synthetase
LPLYYKTEAEHQAFLLRIFDSTAADYDRIESVLAFGTGPSYRRAALRQAGVVPDSFLPEYGARQYEVTCQPTIGLRAADDAIVMREIARSTALRMGAKAIFSPILDPGGVGNGVHIHFSFENKNGKPLSFDRKASNGVSAVAAPFIAGVLTQGRALCAVTAPSRISYDRLRPNAWSASVTNLGHRDREALVRICPISEKPGAKVERSFNFEYRAADAAATPHLALGAIVRAGLIGLRGKLALPKAATVIEIAKMSDAEKKANGIETLPGSLGDALDQLEKAPAALMPEGLKQPYLMHKRGEIQYTAEIVPETLFSMYAQVY